jgi:adenylylsulfate kinase
MATKYVSTSARDSASVARIATPISRIAYVADLLTRNGVVVIVAAISPYRAAREAARRRIGAFVEVYVACTLEELQRRDVRGLYARAARGEIVQFTGIPDPYEVPPAPELVVETDRVDVEAGVLVIVDRLRRDGWLTPEGA